MDIKNLRFLTELSDEDASHVNGGYYDYNLLYWFYTNYTLPSYVNSLFIVG